MVGVPIAIIAAATSSDHARAPTLPQSIESGQKSFKQHLTKETSAARDVEKSAKAKLDTVDKTIKSSKTYKSYTELNRANKLHNPSLESLNLEGAEDGTDIAVRALSIAKEFEAYFLKEMWKNIDGFKLSSGQDSDMMSDIWCEELLNEWFAGGADDEGGQIARDMSEQLVRRYQKSGELGTKLNAPKYQSAD